MPGEYPGPAVDIGNAYNTNANNLQYTYGLGKPTAGMIGPVCDHSTPPICSSTGRSFGMRG